MKKMITQYKCEKVKKITKILLYVDIALIIVMLNCFLPTLLLAYGGGRPLAMGGAFTAVADSVDAIYWNPAGLAQPWVGGINATFVTNWHDFNYDMYFAIGGKGLGLAYIYNKDYLLKLGDWGWITQDWDYFQLSYGAYLIKKWNLSLGVSGKTIQSEFEIDAHEGSKYGQDKKLDKQKIYDLDAGIHWAFGPNVAKYKMFSIGCLVQNICESEFKFNVLGKELTQKFYMDIRQGLSFRPDDMSIISLDIHDFTSELYNKRLVQIGTERWFGFGKKRKVLALRAGGYHMNELYMRAYTGGLGWKFEDGNELAYTIMHWEKENKNSHFISLNLKF